MKKIAGVLALCFCIPFFCSAFSKVESTGKNALILMSLSEEQQLGRESYAEILRESKLSTNKEYNDRLNNVASRLISAIGNEAPVGTVWEYHVIEEDVVNAFALPGGQFAVYTGLMAIANDDELAYVVGHELSHVTARHGAQRMSQQAVISVAGQLAQGMFNSSAKQQIFAVAYGLGTELGATLPFSRSNELEADDVGSRYAAQAGFNPAGGITMIDKLAAASGGSSSSDWLSTHPADSKRKSQLQNLYARNKSIYEKAIAK